MPDEVVTLSFELLPISYIFPEGHRVRVVVSLVGPTTPAQSPVPTVTVYRDMAHPSSITLPVIE